MMAELTKAARGCGRVGLIFILLALGAAPASAEEPSALVRVSPAQAVVGEGLTAAVDVRVEGVQDLYALDIRLAFDPALVQVVDADPAMPGTQVRPGDLLKLDVLARNTADNEAGSIWFAMTQANPSPAVSGDGVALTVTFRGRAAGGGGPLAVTYAKLATRSGRAIPVEVRAGELAVVPASQAAATPTPAPPPPRPALEQTQVALAAGTPAPSGAGGVGGPLHTGGEGQGSGGHDREVKATSGEATPVPALVAAAAGGLLVLGIDGWWRYRRRGAA